LKEHRDKLNAVAEQLMEVETLDMADFEAVWNGQPPRDKGAPAAPPAPSTPGKPSPESPAPSGGKKPVPVPA
ncbi:MAG TPA: hypothetical protein VJ754_10235, partial [Anaerolineae bacterium]|nr:hypothetical protein [Anaerolineae bacterium]